MGIKKITAVMAGLVLALLTAAPETIMAEAIGEKQKTTDAQIDLPDYDYSKGIVIVSLGDSYSAGEGIEPFYGQSQPLNVKRRNPDWLAHRSELSWPGQLTFPGIAGTLSDYRDTNWYFVAASGATTDHMKNAFEKTYTRIFKDEAFVPDTVYLKPQLSVFDQLRREGKTADYVTLTLGGNDVHFSDIITKAVTGSTYLKNYADYAPEPLNPPEIQALNALVGSKLEKLLDDTWEKFENEGGREKLAQAYRDIAQAAGPQAVIIVAGYPRLLQWAGNGLFFSLEEAIRINSSVTRFNEEISKLVDKLRSEEGLNIVFVDIQPYFKTHEAYTSDPYIREVELLLNSEDLKMGVGSAYSMHPNEKGAAAYAKAVSEQILLQEDLKYTYAYKNLTQAQTEGEEIGIFCGTIGAASDAESESGTEELYPLNDCTISLYADEDCTQLLYEYSQNGHYGFYLPVIAGSYYYKVTNDERDLEYYGECEINSLEETRVEIPEKVAPWEMYTRAVELTTRDGSWYESGEGWLAGQAAFLSSQIDYRFDIQVTGFDPEDPGKLTSKGTGLYNQEGMQMGVSMDHAGGETAYTFHAYGAAISTESVSEQGSFLTNTMTQEMFDESNVLSSGYSSFSLALSQEQLTHINLTSLGYLGEVNSFPLQQGTMTVSVYPDRSLKSIEINTGVKEGDAIVSAALECDIVYYFSKEQIREPVVFSDKGLEEMTTDDYLNMLGDIIGGGGYSGYDGSGGYDGSDGYDDYDLYSDAVDGILGMLGSGF